MSRSIGMQNKIEAHRNAWIRTEANKIARAIETEKLVSLIQPDLENRIKEWIREEVAAHCKREVFVTVTSGEDAPPSSPSGDEEEEFVQMLEGEEEKIDADLDYLPCVSNPPRLMRQ